MIHKPLKKKTSNQVNFTKLLKLNTSFNSVQLTNASRVSMHQNLRHLPILQGYNRWYQSQKTGGSYLEVTTNVPICRAFFGDAYLGIYAAYSKYNMQMK